MRKLSEHKCRQALCYFGDDGLMYGHSMSITDILTDCSLLGEMLVQAAVEGKR